MGGAGHLTQRGWPIGRSGHSSIAGRRPRLNKNRKPVEYMRMIGQEGSKAVPLCSKTKNLTPVVKEFSGFELTPGLVSHGQAITRWNDSTLPMKNTNRRKRMVTLTLNKKQLTAENISQEIPFPDENLSHEVDGL